MIGLLFIPWMLIGAGCDRQKTTSPEIADSTLIPLLAELHLAQARQEMERDLPRSIRDSILRRYDADSAAFARTLSYYTRHPKEYNQLYDEVVFRLEEQRRDTTRRRQPDSAVRRHPSE